LGYLSIGGASFGAYAIGGYANAKHIAIGGYADGTIAIGQRAYGTYTIVTNANGAVDVPMHQFDKAVNDYLPKANNAMINLFRLAFK